MRALLTACTALALLLSFRAVHATEAHDDAVAACIAEADGRGLTAAGTVTVSRATVDAALAFHWTGDPVDATTRTCLERALAAWAGDQHDDAESLSMQVAFDTTAATAMRDLLDEDGRVIEGAVRFDLDGHWDTPRPSSGGSGERALPLEPAAEEQRAAFQAVLDRGIPAAERCYRERFAAHGPAGRVAVQLGVRPDGVVERAQAVGRPVDDEVAACVLREARALRFPASAAGADLIWPVAFGP